MKITTCAACKTEQTIDPLANGWIAVQLPDRGNKPAYMCPPCATRIDSYYDENCAVKGSNDKFTISFEFETMRPTAAMQAYMLEQGFRPTYDCTVDAEYKSPIYQGLKTFARVAITLDKYNGVEYALGGCGTHCNVGIPGVINADAIAAIARNYYALFGWLSNTLSVLHGGCACVFGRELNEWAEAITPKTNPYNHSNFINLQHDTHIEYRICKFQNKQQYLHAAKCCVEMTRCIATNFLAYANTPKEAHKAQITGKKLKKIFWKYGMKAMEF